MNEWAGVGNHNTAEFWEYDTRTTQRLNLDPVVDPSVSSYATFERNPIWKGDVLGNVPSTHTDKEGKVIAVYKDGDKGVYKHGDNADGSTPSQGQIDKRHEKSTSAGGIKMGETDFEDEFVNFNTGKPEGYILYSDDPKQSWDVLVNWGHARSNSQDLSITRDESKNYGILDIKTNKDWTISPNPFVSPVMTGRKLNGNYATARSAGNYLAGLNGVTGTYMGKHISGTTYMKLAGAYQVKKFSFINALKIVTTGKSFGPPPYYGEEPYSGRRILQGIQAGEKELNDKKK